MTSEEQFKKLWDERFKYLGIGGLMSYEDFAKSIWLEATRQTMEEAIRICKSGSTFQIKSDGDAADKIIAQAFAASADALAKTLQARLREMMP